MATTFNPTTLFPGYTDPGDKMAFGMKDVEELQGLGATPAQIKDIAGQFSGQGLQIGPQAQSYLGTLNLPTSSATTTAIDPSQSTLSPNFASYIYNMLGKGEAAANMPFTPYTGQRFADVSPLQQRAFEGLYSLQTPGQFGLGSSLVSQAGLGSFTSPGTSSAFMSPYMQDVVDAQKKEARRQADISATQRGAKFAQAGAFGGARQAIENAEAERNLQQRMGDIQTQGLQSAFDRAQQQYNTERLAQIQAGLGLGSLGAQQFGTDYQRMMGQLSGGQEQRKIAQDPLDFGYEQFQASMKYPYQQATFMQSLLQGLPLAARPYDTGQSGMSALLQGGLGGLALWKALSGNKD